MKPEARLGNKQPLKACLQWPISATRSQPPKRYRITPEQCHPLGNISNSNKDLYLTELIVTFPLHCEICRHGSPWSWIWVSWGQGLHLFHFTPQDIEPSTGMQWVLGAKSVQVVKTSSLWCYSSVRPYCSRGFNNIWEGSSLGWVKH